MLIIANISSTPVFRSPINVNYNVFQKGSYISKFWNLGVAFRKTGNIQKRYGLILEMLALEFQNYRINLLPHI